MFAATTEHQAVLLQLAAIVVLGIGAQWVAARIKFPAIVFLLALGLIAGPVSGFLKPDQLFGEQLLFPLVSLFVAIILFDGGLSLKLSELKAGGTAVMRLVVVAGLMTWLLSALAARYVLGMEWKIALILGAILIVTGPTVVGPLLQHIRPQGRVSAIAKWEGIVIDPVGAMIALLVFEAVVETYARPLWWMILLGLTKPILIGVGVNLVITPLLILSMRRFWIPERLQSAALLMAVVSSYALSDLMQRESGLVTVTLMGILLANQRIVPIKHIMEFKETLGILLLSILFIVLAARVTAEELRQLDGRHVLFVAVMILLVRPISVFLATIRTDLEWRERIFLSWLAPRGIVAAAVAAIFSLSLDQTAQLAPSVFAVICATVTVYGLTAKPLAQRLGLAQPEPQGVLIASAHAGVRAIAAALKEAGFRVMLVDTNYQELKTARQEGLETHFASILAPSVLDELDLGGIGHFFAMTRNEEVNTLAAARMADVFSRSRVYQLAVNLETSSRRRTDPDIRRGRSLFGTSMSYQSLDQRFEHGGVIKSTKLTKEFDFEAYKKHYGETAYVLFVVTELGKLRVRSDVRMQPPKPGQTVISLVDGVNDEYTAASVAAHVQ